MYGRRKQPETPPPASAQDPSDAEDVALMLRAAADDAGAFSALVRKHEKSLANFFARNGVYRDVEDLAQLTFLKLHRARRGYRPTAKFTTFLYLLARQVLVDHVRATRRRAKLHEEAGKEMDSVQPAPRSRGEGQDARAALDSLSPWMRETVVLVVMQGLAYHEAAEVLRVPVGTVKSRVSAALRQMKAFLEQTP